MSGDEDFSAPLPFLKCLCFLTFNLAWLVIGCVLYTNGTSQYGMVIEHETAEWNKSPIVDFMATSD
jgi:predicted membrane channel-forming protein YqfA (hemolysin III family)